MQHFQFSLLTSLPLVAVHSWISRTHLLIIQCAATTILHSPINNPPFLRSPSSGTAICVLMAPINKTWPVIVGDIRHHGVSTVICSCIHGVDMEMSHSDPQKLHTLQTPWGECVMGQCISKLAMYRGAERLVVIRDGGGVWGKCAYCVMLEQRALGER